MSIRLASLPFIIRNLNVYFEEDVCILQSITKNLNSIRVSDGGRNKTDHPNFTNHKISTENCVLKRSYCTVFKNYQKSLIVASEASNVNFQKKTFGESFLPLINSFRFFQILGIYSVK